MKESVGRPKAAVYHPWLIEGGGSEAVALWAARALSYEFAVDILTMGETPLDRLNAAYGTDLREPEIGLIRIPVPRLLRRRGDALRAALAARAVRPLLSGYDLLFSSYNVMDFGRRGLQYISDFSFDDAIRRACLGDTVDGRELRRRPAPWRSLYLGTARKIARQSRSGWRRNLTLANSRWSRDLMAEVFGVESEVVYPPVVAPDPDVAWEKRADGFVTIGRIVPEKRVDELADIVAEVGRANRDVHLHVLGRVPDDALGRTLAAKARASAGSLRLEGPVYGEAKRGFLLGHRYGLSGRRHEPFGMSAAEMVRAGLIVWVPQSGGQVEIVDHPELVFESPADAAAKIGRVMADPARQRALLAHLRRQAAKFAIGGFVEGIRRAGSEFREIRHAG
ncbi:MAG: glycosyltransferase family 4 protein [Acidobacteriota bacterium]|nr:glycosyltransferase family 4 protein [Acidobacteriota bacterium]